MALKLTYRTAEEIPAEHKTLYTERNGSFVLDVDGAVSVETHEATRTTAARLEKERQALQAELQRVRIEDGALHAALAHGLVPGAEEDIKARARKALVLVDGKTAKVEADGSTTPIDIAEWAAGVAKKSPHLFQLGTGSGAAGTRASSAAQVVNPWKKESWNITAQIDLANKDKELANTLMAMAGAKPLPK